MTSQQNLTNRRKLIKNWGKDEKRMMSKPVSFPSSSLDPGSSCFPLFFSSCSPLASSSNFCRAPKKKISIGNYISQDLTLNVSLRQMKKVIHKVSFSSRTISYAALWSKETDLKAGFTQRKKEQIGLDEGSSSWWREIIKNQKKFTFYWLECFLSSAKWCSQARQNAKLSCFPCGPEPKQWLASAKLMWKKKHKLNQCPTTTTCG